MEALLKAYPVVITVPIFWGDMDAFLHVNNKVYFKHFEQVRMAYFDRIKSDQLMRDNGIGPILAETSCRFRIPLTYPDDVSIGTRITQIDADRFNMEYLVVSHQHQKVAAEGKGLIVMYDYRNHKKASLPEVLRQRIEEIERL